MNANEEIYKVNNFITWLGLHKALYELHHFKYLDYHCGTSLYMGKPYVGNACMQLIKLFSEELIMLN